MVFIRSMGKKQAKTKSNWMHISQDSFLGAQLKAGKFWKRIKIHYMATIGKGKV